MMHGAPGDQEQRGPAPSSQRPPRRQRVATRRMAESQAQQASTRSPARKKAAGTGRRATGRPKARQTEAERQAAEAAAQEKRARKAAASAAKKAAKEAEKEAARAAKQAEKEAERAAKKARREEAKAAKKAAKQAEKQAKVEERARLRAEKEAEKEAEKVARAEERGRAAKCGADLAARVGCTAVHLVNLVNPTGNLVNLAATPTAAAVTNTTIALDEFIACGARIVALLFVNKLFIATKNGRAALDWVGGRLSGEAHDYEARFAMLCGPFCQVCLEFFQQLAAAACSIAGLADKACAVRRLWRAGGGDGAGPGTVAWEKCVGAAPKCAALVLHALEEGLWSEFLAQIGGNSQPSWDAPPPEAAAALPAAAREKLAYTIGWAFFATTREVRRDEHRSSASEIQRRLGHIAQFLRAAPGGGAAASGGYIAAVEREEGKLLRPTQLGFDFGLQLEVTIDHWLTVPRLLAIGGSLLAEVEQRLLDDNTLVALFRATLPSNLGDIVGLSDADTKIAVQELRRLVIARTMRSRSRHFAGAASAAIRGGQDQATRATVKGASDAAKGKGKKKKSKKKKKARPRPSTAN